MIAKLSSSSKGFSRMTEGVYLMLIFLILVLFFIIDIYSYLIQFDYFQYQIEQNLVQESEKFFQLNLLLVQHQRDKNSLRQLNQQFGVNYRYFIQNNKQFKHNQLMNLKVEYHFKLSLERLIMPIDLAANLCLQWAGKKFKQTTKKNNKISHPPIKYIDFNEEMQIKIKCKIIGGQFKPCNSIIYVLLFPQGTTNTKTAGNVQMDLTQLLDVSNYKASTLKRYEKPIRGSYQQSNPKLIFSLSSTFISQDQNFSMNNISFEAINNNSMFNKTTQVTFRPPSIESRGERKSDRQQKENQHHNKYRTNSFSKKEEHQQVKNEQPLGFSFGPLVSNPQKEKQKKVLMDQISEMNRELVDLKKQRESLRYQLKEKSHQLQKTSSDDQRRVALINQLNSSTFTIDSLKKEKKELMVQLDRSKQQIQELVENYQKVKRDSQTERQQMANRYELKKKELQYIKTQYQKLSMKNSELKQQNFKMQNELIINQKSQKQLISKMTPFEQIKRTNNELLKQRQEMEKMMEQKLRILDREQQKSHHLEGQLEKYQEQLANVKRELHASKQKQKEYNNNLSQIEMQMQQFYGSTKQKEQSFQSKFSEKLQQLSQKQHHLNQLKQQLTDSQTEFEKAKTEIDSKFIQISELKVKIKNLEEISQNYQKDIAEKQQQIEQRDDLLQKAKLHIKSREEDWAIKIQEYRQFITVKDRENNQKQQVLVELQKKVEERERILKDSSGYCRSIEEALKERERQLREKQSIISEKDTIIMKAKQYISTKQQQQSHSRQQQNNQLNTELAHLRNAYQEGQNINNQLINELRQKDERLDELTQYIQTLQSKLQMYQDQLEELVRKTRSQDETLEELIQKNLEYEVQLNVKDFQLTSLQSKR